MKRGNIACRSSVGRLGAVMGVAAIGLLFSASQASAGCVVPGKAGSAPTGFVTGRVTLPPIQQGGDPGGQPATIVGLWHVIYTATSSTAGPIPVPVIPPGSPDSFEFAETMKTWHADGTEWEEKIQPAPAGFCFGVWKHAEQDTIKLHHFGAITGPDGSVVAIFWMDEINRVAPDGRTYSGTWDFKLYGPADVFGTGPVLQEIAGNTAATRITVQ
jgi:hypothetical protein